MHLKWDETKKKNKPLTITEEDAIQEAYAMSSVSNYGSTLYESGLGRKDLLPLLTLAHKVSLMMMVMVILTQ